MAEPSPATIPFIGPDGVPVLVPTSRASALIGQPGFRPMTPQEAAEATRRADLKARYSGLGAVESAAGGFAAGALRPLTFGYSDDAIIGLASALGDEQTGEAARAKLRDYAEVSPVATGLGELAGIVAPALLGDEAVLGAAPGAISRIGGGLGEAVGSGLGKVTGSALLGRGAGALTRLGVEGALYGVGAANSEATLQNRRLTPEALIAHAKHGAAGAILLGAPFEAAGALVGGLGSRLGRVRAPATAEALDEVAASRLSGMPAEGATAEAGAAGPMASATGGKRTTFDKVADTYIRKVSDTEAQAAENGEVWAKRQQLLADHEKLIEDRSRELSKAIDSVFEAGRTTDNASFGAGKVRQMRGLVDEAKFSEQKKVVGEWLDAARGDIEELKANKEHLAPATRREFEGHLTRIERAVAESDSNALHNALDNLKRFAGKRAGFGRPPFQRTPIENMFEAFYQAEPGSVSFAPGGLKQLLEHEPTWGAPAADAQKAINAATADMISYGKIFNGKFKKEFGSLAGEPLYAADTSAVSGFMGKLTNARNDLDARALKAFVETRRKYLDAVSEHYSFGKKEASNIAKERAALDKMDEVFARTSKDVELANRVKDSLASERARNEGFASKAMGVATAPVSTLMKLAQLERVTNSVAGGIKKGVSKFVGQGSAKAGAEAGEQAAKAAGAAQGKGFFSTLADGINKTSAAASDVAKGVAKAAPAIGSFAGEKQFRARVNALASASTDAAVLSAAVGKMLAPYEDAAPNVVSESVQVAHRGVAFLSSKLPPSRQDPFSMQPQFQPSVRASDSEIARFNRYFEAVDSPLMVMGEARKGTLSRDHIEAVKAVYPEIYAKIRQETFERCIDAKSPLSYSARIQLGILLDIPTDKTLAPEFLKTIQTMYAASNQPKPPPPTSGTVPKLGDDQQTSLQKAASRI